MAYEQRPGDISVFAETDKKNEKAPDWKGTMIVPDGVQPGDKLEVAVWAKGDRGTMLAGSVKPPRARDGEQTFRGADAGGVARGGGGGDRQDGQRTGTRSAEYDLSDDIPFVRPALNGEA